MRHATLHRKTNETDIRLSLALDGTGKYDVSSGIRFLDHMLELFARHGGFDLKLSANGDLDDLPEVHDRDPVRHVPHDAEVVRDEDVGQPELVLEVGEEVEHLRLDRDVKGRDGLVGDDDRRVDGERPGDADPLALTS